MDLEVSTSSQRAGREVGQFAFKNRIKEQNHSKISKPSKSAIFVRHLLPLKTFYANLHLLAYSLLSRVQGQGRGHGEKSPPVPLSNVYAVYLSPCCLDASRSQCIVLLAADQTWGIIYPNPHGLCHLLILPTETIVIARTRAVPNTFYSWLHHTPLFVQRRETTHACACHSTQEHGAHFQIHASFCLVCHHLRPLDRKFENCLGNPQHHQSMC